MESGLGVGEWVQGPVGALYHTTHTPHALRGFRTWRDTMKHSVPVSTWAWFEAVRHATMHVSKDLAAELGWVCCGPATVHNTQKLSDADE